MNRLTLSVGALLVTALVVSTVGCVTQTTTTRTATVGSGFTVHQGHDNVPLYVKVDNYTVDSPTGDIDHKRAYVDFYVRNDGTEYAEVNLVSPLKLVTTDGNEYALTPVASAFSWGLAPNEGAMLHLYADFLKEKTPSKIKTVWFNEEVSWTV